MRGVGRTLFGGIPFVYSRERCLIQGNLKRHKEGKKHCTCEATLKKKFLFPVQQVAMIMASRAAAKSFFFRFYFFW